MKVIKEGGGGLRPPPSFYQRHTSTHFPRPKKSTETSKFVFQFFTVPFCCNFTKHASPFVFLHSIDESTAM